MAMAGPPLAVTMVPRTKTPRLSPSITSCQPSDQSACGSYTYQATAGSPSRHKTLASRIAYQAVGGFVVVVVEGTVVVVVGGTVVVVVGGTVVVVVGGTVVVVAVVVVVVVVVVVGGTVDVVVVVVVVVGGTEVVRGTVLVVVARVVVVVSIGAEVVVVASARVVAGVKRVVGAEDVVDSRSSSGLDVVDGVTDRASTLGGGGSSPLPVARAAQPTASNRMATTPTIAARLTLSAWT